MTPEVRKNRVSIEIYVMWGQIKDSDAWIKGELDDALEFPVKHRDDQASVLSMYPEAGYLRELAGVVPYIKELSETYAGPDPYSFIELFGWIQPNGVISLDD